jgi:serine/threonine-protein kinase
MSPEQCKGERNLTYKSDLYSLGVVLYELITGKKPFVAEHAMEMFLLHVQGAFERPSRVVLDVPVWLDNLICQLLEKKPEARPFDAAMVSKVLGTIQEKVEAQQSAGVDAARARLMDRPKDLRNPSDEDRAAARSLLGKKARRKSAKKGRNKLIWVQALGLLFLLAGVIAVLVIVLRPPSAEKLHAQAQRLMTSAKEEDWDKGREGPVRDFLARFGEANDEKTKKMADEVRQWADAYDIRRYEQLMGRYVRHETGQSKGLAVEAQSGMEKKTFDAALAEYEGDREKAAKLWQQVESDGTAQMRLVARKHLDLLRGIDTEEERLWGLRLEVRNRRTEPQLDEWQQQAFLAVRQERLGDLAGAQRRYQRLRDQARKDPAQQFWAAFAAVKNRQLKDRLADKPQDDKARLAVVEKVVADVVKERAAKKTSLLDQRVRLQDVVVLYEDNKEMAQPVKKARELIAKIDATLPRRR